MKLYPLTDAQRRFAEEHLGDLETVRRQLAFVWVNWRHLPHLDPDDVLVLGYLRAVQTYDGSTRFTTWLYRIAINRVFEEQRRARCERRARQQHRLTRPHLYHEPAPAWEHRDTLRAYLTEAEVEEMLATESEWRQRTGWSRAYVQHRRKWLKERTRKRANRLHPDGDIL